MAEAKAFKMIPHCTFDTITYEMDELIRCKDCINYGNNGCRLKRMAYQTAPDWFCADGIAKDTNVPGKEGR